MNQTLPSKIFRKPSQTITIINNNSNHPISHKRATFHSLIHRLTTIPMNQEDKNTKISIIKQIATNNNYNPQLIDNIIRKKINNPLKITIQKTLNT